MKAKIIAVVATALLITGCEELDGLHAVTGLDNLPAGVTLTGRWAGEISNSAGTTPTVPAELQLNQSGTSVSGSLTINNARAATVNGTLSGTRLNATWTYVDLCGGSATTAADVVSNGTRITGTYTSTDCLGVTSGNYSFIRQP